MLLRSRRLFSGFVDLACVRTIEILTAVIIGFRENNDNNNETIFVDEKQGWASRSDALYLSLLHEKCVPLSLFPVLKSLNASVQRSFN